jgi:hypothetical protein
MTRTALLGTALGAVFFVASWVLVPGDPAVGAMPTHATDTRPGVSGSVSGFEHMVAVAEAASSPGANFGF